MLRHKLADENASFKSYDVELTEDQKIECNNCNLTFANFEKLLNHSCLPYRCKTCSMAFLYDYRLKMHTCHKKHISTRSHADDYESSNLTLFQVSKFFSPHQSSSTSSRKKYCNVCEHPLPHKCQGELCKKYKVITRKYKDHSLEYSKRNKNPSNVAILDNNFTESHNGRNSESASKSSTVIPKLRMKKKSASNMLEVCKKHCPEKNKNKKVDTPTQNANNKFKLKKKINKKDCVEVGKIFGIKTFDKGLNGDCIVECNDSSKNFKILNTTRKKRRKHTDLETNSKRNKNNVEDVDNFGQSTDRKHEYKTKVFEKSKPVDVQENSNFENLKITGIMIDVNDSQSNDLSICKSSVQSDMNMGDDLSETCYTNGNSEVAEENKHDSKNFPIFNSEIKCKVKRKLPKVYKVKKSKSAVDTESSSSKETLSVLSESYVKDSCKEINLKCEAHASTCCDLCENNESNLKMKSPNGMSSSIYSKSNETQIPQKFPLFPKNNNISEIPYSIYNMGQHTRIIEENTTEKNEINLQLPSVIPSVFSEGDDNTSTPIIATPVLEIAESTLNCVPDDVHSPSTSLTFVHEESNLNSDDIKLEDLLNALPDENSGVLLRITSKNGDSFRCLKCNKLFKRIKVAIIHYSNCRNFRVKKKMLFSLNDIEWTCLNCQYHCNSSDELSSHRSSCQTKSTNKSYQNIGFYINDFTCTNICPRCNYSSLSHAMFKNHDCEKRLQHMNKCFIPIKKLSKVDLYDANLAKFSCNSCGIDFYNTSTYQRHEELHTAIKAKKIFIGKAYAEEEMKKILKKKQDLLTADDIIKSWIEPISQIYTECDNFPFPGLDLNILIPQEVDKLLPDVAKQLISAKEKEDIQNITEGLNFTEMISNLSSSFNEIGEKDQNNLESDEVLNGYKCVCERQKKKPEVSKNSKDSKDTKDGIVPCQVCMSNCMSDRVHTFVDDVDKLDNDIEANIKKQETPINNNFCNDSTTNENTCNSCPELPINIISVTSCSEQENLNNPDENFATSCPTQNPGTSHSTQSGILDYSILNVDNSNLCIQSEAVSSSYFKNIFTHDENFQISREPVESDFTIITAVTLKKLPENSSKYHVKNYNKLFNALNTFKKNYESEADSSCSNSNIQYNASTLNRYFRPEIQENFQQCNPTSKTSEHESPLESNLPPKNLLNVDCNSNTSQNLLPDEMHHILNSTSTFTENCELQCASVDYSSNSHAFKVTCPIDKIIKFLALQNPCNVDIILSNNIFIIHVTLEIISKSVSYVVLNNIDSEIDNFLCSKCLDCISSSDLPRHFYNIHEEKEFYILLA